MPLPCNLVAVPLFDKSRAPLSSRPSPHPRRRASIKRSRSSYALSTRLRMAASSRTFSSTRGWRFNGPGVSGHGPRDTDRGLCAQHRAEDHAWTDLGAIGWQTVVILAAGRKPTTRLFHAAGCRARSAGNAARWRSHPHRANRIVYSPTIGDCSNLLTGRRIEGSAKARSASRGIVLD